MLTITCCGCYFYCFIIFIAFIYGPTSALDCITSHSVSECLTWGDNWWPSPLCIVSRSATVWAGPSQQSSPLSSPRTVLSSLSLLTRSLGLVSQLTQIRKWSLLRVILRQLREKVKECLFLCKGVKRKWMKWIFRCECISSCHQNLRPLIVSSCIRQLINFIHSNSGKLKHVWTCTTWCNSAPSST